MHIDFAFDFRLEILDKNKGFAKHQTLLVAHFRTGEFFKILARLHFAIDAMPPDSYLIRRMHWERLDDHWPSMMARAPTANRKKGSYRPALWSVLLHLHKVSFDVCGRSSAQRRRIFPDSRSICFAENCSVLCQWAKCGSDTSAAVAARAAPRRPAPVRSARNRTEAKQNVKDRIKLSSSNFMPTRS